MPQELGQHRESSLGRNITPDMMSIPFRYIFAKIKRCDTYRHFGNNYLIWDNLREAGFYF